MQAHHHEGDQVGNTPIDIAGERENHECAIILVQYLTQSYDVVATIYKGGKDGQINNQIANLDKKEKTDDEPWTLNRVWRKRLTEEQARFLKVYYWSAFYGLKKSVDIFLKIGISPFIKT